MAKRERTNQMNRLFVPEVLKLPSSIYFDRDLAGGGTFGDWKIRRKPRVGNDGRVAELADARDLKSRVRKGRGGSSPPSATCTFMRKRMRGAFFGILDAG